MKLFKWTSGHVVDEYAMTLARDFSLFCAQPKSSNITDKIFEKKVEQALFTTFEKIRIFRIENSLGVFKRARFAKVFQDELLRLGYAPELVGRVTTALVTSALSGK